MHRDTQKKSTCIRRSAHVHPHKHTDSSPVHTAHAGEGGESRVEPQSESRGSSPPRPE